jgi:hypothetical protein
MSPVHTVPRVHTHEALTVHQGGLLNTDAPQCTTSTAYHAQEGVQNSELKMTDLSTDLTPGESGTSRFLAETFLELTVKELVKNG